MVHDHEEFTVKEILQYHYSNCQHQFLILWDEHPREDATWEPLSNLTNCRNLVTKFKKAHGLNF